MFIETLFLIGVVAGLLGPFLLVKRQTLAVDAIAHGSFGGAAIAYFYGINPLYGALVFAALLAYALTLYFKQRQEIVLGLILVLGMSLGLVFFSLAGISKDEIIVYLFGNMSLDEFKTILNWIAGLITIGFLTWKSRHIFSVFFDPEGSQVRGIPVTWIEGIFNGLLAVVIVGMLSVVGALLVSGLMIIPALIAERIVPSFRYRLIIAGVTGGLGMVGGYFLANMLGLPPTPVVIFLLAFIYGVLGVIKK
ncbi:MAG: metal ABC transporter permease [Candidatus Micrarchaeota archaeon]|nr:metal ABC transporter permease [Candidatus Micrarchaeota archaeon]